MRVKCSASNQQRDSCRRRDRLRFWRLFVGCAQGSATIIFRAREFVTPWRRLSDPAPTYYTMWARRAESGASCAAAKALSWMDGQGPGRSGDHANGVAAQPVVRYLHLCACCDLRAPNDRLPSSPAPCNSVGRRHRLLGNPRAMREAIRKTKQPL
jgi:hypothetical protein